MKSRGAEDEEDQEEGIFQWPSKIDPSLTES